MNECMDQSACHSPNLLKPTPGNQDMRLAVLEGDRVCVSTPVFAASNESFKRAKEAGLGDSDISAVYGPMLAPKKE